MTKWLRKQWDINQRMSMRLLITTTPLHLQSRPGQLIPFHHLHPPRTYQPSIHSTNVPVTSTINPTHPFASAQVVQKGIEIEIEIEIEASP